MTAMTHYITQAHEVLDAICFTHYGHERGTTEKVLAVNPHLRQYGTHLPTGVVIVLPDITQATETPQVQLWD